MKLLLWCAALAWIWTSPLCAQTAIPARPADPNQAIPAQPVNPVPVPPPPQSPSAKPASSAAPDPVKAADSASGPVAFTLIADSSLKAVIQDLAQAWADSQNNSPQVPLTLTNAATLRSKVQAGSTWDLVISADVQDVKAMTASGVLIPDGQRSLARNSLTVYGRKALVKDDQLDWFDLVGSEWKKVALGNPDLTGSGRIAKIALQKHDLLSDDNKDVFLYTPTESRAIGLIEQEKADAVFAYKTDLVGVSLPGFEAINIKSEDAPPVFYTAAVCSNSKNQAQAQAFIQYCGSPEAKAIWTKYGFETN